MEVKSHSDLQEYHRLVERSKEIHSDLNTIDVIACSSATRNQMKQALIEELNVLESKVSKFIKFNLHSFDNVRAEVETITLNNDDIDRIKLEDLKKAEFVLLENGEYIKANEHFFDSYNKQKANLASLPLEKRKFLFKSETDHGRYEPVYAFRVIYVITE